MQGRTVTSDPAQGPLLSCGSDLLQRRVADQAVSPPAKRAKPDGLLGQMVDEADAQGLRRADSVEDFARAFVPHPEPRTASRQVFDDALARATHELAAMRLWRSNRPSFEQGMRPYPQAAALRDIAPIRDEVDAILGKRLARHMSHVQRLDVLGQVSLEVYAGTKEHEAYCDEHMALAWGILRREGVPANRLVPVECTGATRSGLPVAHVLLLYSDADIRGPRPLSGGGISGHLRRHGGSCEIFDFWSGEKQSRLTAEADVFEQVLRSKLSELDAGFDPATLAWSEAPAPV